MATKPVPEERHLYHICHKQLGILDTHYHDVPAKQNNLNKNKTYFEKRKNTARSDATVEEREEDSSNSHSRLITTNLMYMHSRYLSSTLATQI